MSVSREALIALRDKLHPFMVRLVGGPPEQTDRSALTGAIQIMARNSAITQEQARRLLAIENQDEALGYLAKFHRALSVAIMHYGQQGEELDEAILQALEKGEERRLATDAALPQNPA